jgi:ubiquinone/menaquinone biosynthesis C-methylase UbiE
MTHDVADSVVARPPPPIREVKTLDWMYGDGDLAESAVFAGGYCNFGYWDDIPAVISVPFRAAASSALYREVLAALAAAGPALIEIGAGRGHGARLALAEDPSRHVTAVDQSPQQIARLLHYQRDLIAAGVLETTIAPAEDLPFPAARFDALYSIEALQHFQSPGQFAREASRILRPGGRLAVATFFLQDPAALAAVQAMIPTIRQVITRMTPVSEFCAALEQSGFGEVAVRPIGDRVFPGFDAWLATIGDKAGEKDSWGRNWLRCFTAGLIDYAIVTATRHDA